VKARVFAPRHTALVLAVLLMATAFRFAGLFDSPPGWRDDELIEIDMDVRIPSGWRPLYITEAEGHEPLYHYLHAATLSLFGENAVGYKWLPMAFGVLTVALTHALARRLFGAQPALIAAALMAVSFWPVMYARLGLRHVGVLPWMLGVYLIMPLRLSSGSRHPIARNVVGGICLAAGLLTYFAGRVVPAVVVAFGAYVLVFQRGAFRRVWPRLVAILAVGLVLAAPMFVEINRLLPGGEQRLEVVGPQLAALRQGNLLPALETTLGTLGMFTFRGDPEALYNVAGRPVFDWLTGAFFYTGVALALWRWRRVEYGFTLIALGLGLAPAFVSNPPASFSHTLAAMPIVYVLTGLGVAWAVERGSDWVKRVANDAGRRAFAVGLSSVALIVAMNGVLTVRDYFGVWAADTYVRFLYHAPVRQIARWLDRTPDVSDLAISTHPNYLRLETLALRFDLKRGDVRPRWFDAELAIVYPLGSQVIVGTTLNAAGESVIDWQGCCPDASQVAFGDGYTVWHVAHDERQIDADPSRTFDQQLDLLRIARRESAPPDRLWLDVVWRVRLQCLSTTVKTFVHVVDPAGNILSQFDGLGVYLPSLQPGDVFVQRLDLDRPASASAVRIGLYDPATDSRWRLPDGSEFVTFSIP